jgi:hypothetical protein
MDKKTVLSPVLDGISIFAATSLIKYCIEISFRKVYRGSLTICFATAYIFQGDLSAAKPYCDDALRLFHQIGSSKGDEVEMHTVDTLLYKAIITIKEEGYSKNVANLAQEAIETCKKYPNNIDAQEYPRTINALLKPTEDTNN